MLEKPSKLTVRTPGQEVRVIELEKRPLHVGRAKASEICLDDLLVSRQHAVFNWEGDDLCLNDLNSANGTMVNGHRISGSVRVRTGDRVQIGDTIIEVGEIPTTDQDFQPAGDGVALRPETTLSLPTESLTDTTLQLLIARVNETRRTDRKAEPAAHAGERLAMIHQMARALLSPQTLDEVLRDIVFLVLEVVPAERVFLFFKEEDGDLTCKVACYRHEDDTRDLEPLLISRAVAEEVIDHGRPLLTADTLQDKRFQERQSIIRSGVRSIMAVPLAIGGRNRFAGMLYADSRVQPAGFSQEDLGLLSTVASVMDIKIENARLLEQRLENERMRQQLEKARQIQMRLLPVGAPQPDGYELAGLTVPCYAVGGDYYDFIPLSKGRLAIILADVAGKGLEAALLVSCLHACLHTQAGHTISPAEKIAAVSRYIFANTAAEKFATLFYAELDTRHHALNCVNAGHNPPLLVRADGRVEQVGSGGHPVGLMENATFATARLDIEKNDLLLIYSDGLTEAADKRGEQFGSERLQQALKANLNLPVGQLLDRLLQTHTDFLKGEKPSDDVTMTALRRLG